MMIPLWSESAENVTKQETIIPVPRFNNRVRDMRVVRNIAVPTLTAYLPDSANGAAVLICPGGGFQSLPIDIEGIDVARWLSGRGVAAFVLKYRLLPTATDDETFIQQLQHPDMAQIAAHMLTTIADSKRAIKLVRDRAPQWHIDPSRIGTLGFSAGGIVATGPAMNKDSECRPNFIASIYSPGWRELSPQHDGLPLFMAFASDDPVLSLVSQGSMRMFSAWTGAQQPVEMHVYSRGGHGFGLARQGLPSDHWIDCFWDWLKVNEIVAS